MAKTTAALKKTEPGAASLVVRPNNNIVSIKAQMALELETIASRTAPPGGDKIQVTQDKYFKLPDGRKTAEPIDVVIVDFVAKNEYYPGPFDPKNIVPPACFAIGLNPTTLVPSNNSPDKQASSCAVCPNNVFGSAGDGKACKNGRLLAVLPPDANADTPLMLLSVSPTALKGFDAYVRGVAAQFKLPPIGVVTTVSFDKDVTYASLRFGDPKPNTNLEVFASRREEARTRLETEPDVSQYDSKAAAKKPAAKAVAKPARR